MRIASLLPAGTEIVESLGLSDELVAVTHACNFPSKGISEGGGSSKPRITRSRMPEIDSVREAGPALGWHVGNERLLTIDRDVLRAVHPSIILTQQIDEWWAVPYGDVVDAVSTLPDPQPILIDLQPTSVEEILYGIRVIGAATERDIEADNLCDTLWTRLEHVRGILAHSGVFRPRAMVIEWINPLYCGGFWQHELIRLAGGKDYASTRLESPSTISWHQIREFDPEVLIVAPCNCSVEQSRRDMPALEALPGYSGLTAVKHGRVVLVDGRSYFNSHGPRVLDTLDMLAFFLHPEIFGDLVPPPESAICWL